MVKALHYKPAGRGFDSDCVIGIFYYGPGFYSASNRNELCVFLAWLYFSQPRSGL